MDLFEKEHPWGTYERNGIRYNVQNENPIIDVTNFDEPNEIILFTKERGKFEQNPQMFSCELNTFLRDYKKVKDGIRW